MTKSFILTAGKGTRLKPLTLTTPKPAIKINQVPLVYHSIHLLRKSGVKNFVFNLHYLPEKMRKALEPLRLNDEEFSFSLEEDIILGGAGGLRHAWSCFDTCDEILYCNGDEIFLPETEDVLKKLTEHRKSSNSLATILCIEHPGVGTQFGGVWVNGNNEVKGFGKNPPEKHLSGLHFTGYMALSKEIINHIPADGESNILYGVLDKAIEKGFTVNVLRAEGFWFEVGNPEGLKEAELKLQALAKNDHSYYTDLKKSIST